MGERGLPPEVGIDLQIHLDHVERASRRCRQGLRELIDGKLTAEGYARLLEQHRRAQTAWESKHLKYFGPPRPSH